MRSATEVVLYWDTSAVLAALFRDAHSVAAHRWAQRPGLHLLSSLAWAEAHAVIGRASRERALPPVLLTAARDVLERGPWRRVRASPDWALVRTLSTRWPLRGADLWHLATAKTLQADLPEVRVLSFDAQLTAAAKAEGLGLG
ncbi:MAG: type II toxin-antitoxin system VapC family toxin [Armatimonadota bacterium]|nr:type II toxin-antitoxin system VapC family toxin [Armatimonadota bacterium]